MKRYRLYVKLNTHNEAILKDRYMYYADNVDASRLMNAAKQILAPCILFDNFTGKIIWKSEV